jgi:hypothetical protein
MNVKDEIIKFLLIIIIYLSTWELISMIIEKIKLFRNNKGVLYIILVWISLYILINKYNYKLT